MWSLYAFIWENALKGFLREIKLLGGDFEAGRMFFGRPYWNLGAVKQCLAKMPGFVERDFDTDLSVQIQYDGDGICTPVTAFGLLRAIPLFSRSGRSSGIKNIRPRSSWRVDSTYRTQIRTNLR